jgi:CRP-like cAMP-binding protein
MPTVEAIAVTNALLSSLTPGELHAVLPFLELRDIGIRTSLIEPGATIEHVWFPVTAIASVVTEGEDGSSVEVAIIGRDGLVGGEIFLGVRELAQAVKVQVGGQAFVAPASPILDFGEGSTLARAARRYVHTVMTQASQGVLCNRTHPLEQRAARWLLTVHDRLDGSRFHLTHEYFATMLGSHRPSVSIAAGMLQKAGLIRYARGEVQVLDRDGLRAAACECYDVTLADYRATMRAAGAPA